MRLTTARGLGLAACLTWCASPAAASEEQPLPYVQPGVVDIVFEDSLPGWALAAPEGADTLGSATMSVDGKLVLQGHAVRSGQLNAAGVGLRLVHASGKTVALEDLVFSFDETGGDVHARSTDSRHLFDIDDVVVEINPDGSVLLVASLSMGVIAGDLQTPELQGSHVASLVLNVDKVAVQRTPARGKLASAPTAPGSGSGSYAGNNPDVIVFDVGYDGPNSNDIHYWGQSGGIAAYSIATQSCNIGNALLDWFDSGGQLNHPVIAQNMFRYKNGRLTQIGQSWLKHGFCAVSEIESGCSPCGATNCDTLGIGCADTYWATLNDGRSGGSKAYVNPASGAHTHGSPSPVGNNTTRGRLQVAVADIDPSQNPGAEYFIESQYVTADDAAAGSSANNASWRRVNVISVSNVDGGGLTQREKPAIYAWQDQDPAVQINAVANTGEFGSGKTYFFVAHKAARIGSKWRYEYAIQNLNSDQGADSFSVALDPAVELSNVGFSDVDWHSGDPFDGTDWTTNRGAGDLTWATDDFGTNPDANAIRWGTMYNFWFESPNPPTTGTATIGLFKPGVNSARTVSSITVPSDSPPAQPKTFTGPGNGGTVGG